MPDLDTRKEQIIEEIRNTEYNDLKDMVYRMELTYHEVAEILVTKHIKAKSTGYTFRPQIYEKTDINSKLKSSHPDEVKIKTTIDDIRLKPNLTSNKTIIFTKRKLFYTVLGFTQFHSRLLGDFDGSVELSTDIFCTRSVSHCHQDIKYTKHLEYNYLKKLIIWCCFI